MEKTFVLRVINNNTSTALPKTSPTLKILKTIVEGEHLEIC